MRKKRGVDPVSMSFLDVISCGFGAVILLFMVMKHSANLESATNPAAAEISMLDQEIKHGKAGLVIVHNTIADVDQQDTEAQGLARTLQDQMKKIVEEVTTEANTSLAEKEDIAKLKADIDLKEKELQRLRDSQDEAKGNNSREYVGDGNRQYLTGLILGGNRILILVDSSASMLDNTIVNIIRRRNMPIQERLNSPKWVHVRKTLDWLTSQLPVTSQYQIYTFNKDAKPLLPGTDNKWLDVADSKQLNQAVAAFGQVVPTEGTNLEALFDMVRHMNPLPDNIYLITDGLPTLGIRSKGQGNVSGKEREELFAQAVRQLPRGIPVNTILEPLEGDPQAPGAYWGLAYQTKGSFLMPSADWP
jgi:hypothetical protein